jgi:hypothetical protein
MKNNYTFLNIRKSILSLLILLTVAFNSNGQLYNSLVLNVPGTGTDASHCSAFEAWRLTLTRTDYSRVNIRLNGTILFTCTNPSLVQSMATTLRTSTTAPVTTTWNDGANQWYIGSCGGIEFGVQLGTALNCNCLTSATTATLRPCILGTVWGGVGVNTCGSGPQLVTLEFGSPSGINDAGVSAFVSPSSFSLGVVPVSARVQNFGINQINSVTVNWSVNGVTQTPVLYSSLLDTANGVSATNAAVPLGNVTLANNIIYEIKAWTSAPNSLIDTTPTNDTSTIVLRSPLSGTYTIGALGDFTTITQASNVISAAGISSNVTFELIDPVYNAATGETFPINLRNIPGLAFNRQLTIKPQNSIAPLIVGNTTSSIFNIENAKYVNFDGRWSAPNNGRNLTIENTSTSASASVFIFRNEATGSSVRNCIIRSASNNTNFAPTNAAIFVGGTTNLIGQGNDSLLFRNNTFALLHLTDNH